MSLAEREREANTWSKSGRCSRNNLVAMLSSCRDEPILAHQLTVGALRVHTHRCRVHGNRCYISIYLPQLTWTHAQQTRIGQRRPEFVSVPYKHVRSSTLLCLPKICSVYPVKLPLVLFQTNGARWLVLCQIFESFKQHKRFDTNMHGLSLFNLSE